MTPDCQQNEMLSLLGNALHDLPVQYVENEQWDTYFREYREQTVWALLMPIADSIFRDAEKKIAYEDSVGQNVLSFYRLLEAQKQALAVLSAENIPAAVLKGAAAALNYPCPEYRCMGDIDLIVKPDDFNRAYKTLCDAGYQNENTLEDYRRHIGFRTPSGVELELHNHFSSSKNREQNALLDQMIYEAIDHCSTEDVCGYPVPVLPPLINGLVLLGHINHHLGSGLGLRQIIDWMCFVQKYLDDDLWNCAFREASGKIGMQKLAVITTAMCRKYLGMQSTLTWCSGLSEADQELCDELMAYILSKGNFGRTSEKRSKSVSVIRMFRNPVEGLRSAQQTGCVTWKALKKHPWLKCFAWLYQICRWISHGIREKVNMRHFVQSCETEKSETGLLKRLGVTRI